MTSVLDHKRLGLSALALILMTACSGGGGVADVADDAGGGAGGDGGDGGDPFVPDDTPFADPDSIDASDLIVLSLNAQDGTVARVDGTLDRAADTLSFGAVSGTINDARDTVDLSDGQIDIDGETDAFAARFDAAQGAVNTLGILGVATDAAALPSGTASYTGDTVITATSGTDVFELTGVASITANFGGDESVTTALTALTGTRQPAGAVVEDIADAGALTISGSGISGNGFSGGSAALTSDVLSLTGDVTTALEGGFYGPDADEVGGVFIVDDGTTRIFGDFLAD